MKKNIIFLAGFAAASFIIGAAITITANNKEKPVVPANEDWWDYEETIETEQQIEEEEAFENFSVTFEYAEDYCASEPVSEGPAMESKDIDYVIVYGDSWWSIAESFHGDGTLYSEIAIYNGLDPNNIIYEGQIIKIPSKENLSIGQATANKYNTAAKAEMEVIATVDSNDYTYGVRTNPTVDISLPDDHFDMRNNTDEVDTSTYEYIGGWNITGYDPECAHCCGGNTHGIGAAGVDIRPGYSVATKDLPLGVTLYIEGYGYYVNEDRGCGYGVIDIAATSHDACYALTSESPVDVYIVK